MAIRDQPFLWTDQKVHGGFDWVITGADFLYMGLEAILYFTLTIVLERLYANPAFVRRIHRDPVVRTFCRFSLPTRRPFLC
jgi:hypothetical protein